MPSSRSTSPAATEKGQQATQKDDPASLLATLPALQVTSAGAATRSAVSPDSDHISEGSLRVLERLYSSITDVSDSLDENPASFTATGLDLLLEELNRLHVQFQEEYDTLLRNWRPALTEHRFVRERRDKREAKLVHNAKQRIASLKEQFVAIDNATKDTLSTDLSALDQLVTRSKLPELSLPDFSGDSTGWPYFITMFCTIMEKQRLDGTEKLHYLRTALHGAAFELVKSLPPVSESYDAALKLLADRYENARIVIEAQLDKLLALLPIKERSTRALENLLNNVVGYQKLLQQAQPGVEHDNMVVLLMSRLLDDGNFRAWRKRISASHEFPTISEFIEFLKEAIKITESFERERKAPANNKPPTTTLTSPSRTRRSTMAARGSPLAATTSAARTSTQYPCDNCKGDHFLAFCQEFKRKTPSQRLQFVKEEALCMNCLGHHNVRNCRSKYYCNICDERHHSLLHGEDVAGSFLSRSDKTRNQGHSKDEHSKTKPSTRG